MWTDGEFDLVDEIFKSNRKKSVTYERLSRLGGASSTARLLGLDKQPTELGVLAPPPGSADFLSDLSSSKRRTMLREVMNRQRLEMRRLSEFLKREKNLTEDSIRLQASTLEAKNLEEAETADNSELLKAIDDLGKSARMLDVIDDLIKMQDYTLSQIGSYSKG